MGTLTASPKSTPFSCACLSGHLPFLSFSKQDELGLGWLLIFFNLPSCSQARVLKKDKPELTFLPQGPGLHTWGVDSLLLSNKLDLKFGVNPLVDGQVFPS